MKRKTKNELYRLTDKELADMGILRQNIEALIEGITYE